MSRILVSITGALAVAGGLASCQQAVEAPYDTGVCYAVEQGADGEPPRFNVVAENQPQIEFCAARLEEMRQRFLRLGGTRLEIVGAYQGRFIFIDRAGVWFGKSLDGSRFFAMERTSDGRLAIPGAIQRQVETAPPASPPGQ